MIITFVMKSILDICTDPLIKLLTMVMYAIIASTLIYVVYDYSKKANLDSEFKNMYKIKRFNFYVDDIEIDDKEAEDNYDPSNFRIISKRLSYKNFKNTMNVLCGQIDSLIESNGEISHIPVPVNKIVIESILELLGGIINTKIQKSYVSRYLFKFEGKNYIDILLIVSDAYKSMKQGYSMVTAKVKNSDNKYKIIPIKNENTSEKEVFLKIYLPVK